MYLEQFHCLVSPGVVSGRLLPSVILGSYDLYIQEFLVIYDTRALGAQLSDLDVPFSCTTNFK